MKKAGPGTTRDRPSIRAALKSSRSIARQLRALGFRAFVLPFHFGAWLHMNELICLFQSPSRVPYFPGSNCIESPPKLSALKKSQLPAWTSIEEIALSQPTLLRSG
jgi:hypothetical protein